MRFSRIAFSISMVLLAEMGVAEGQTHPYIQKAEAHYQAGEYAAAIRYLIAVPGVAQLAPAVTPMSKYGRARLYFDLGCCYFAAGDSLKADQAFKEAFALDDRLKQGYFKSADPGTFWWALLRNKEAARRLKTHRLFAAMRSLALPGWGQFYRGHKKKGYAFLSAAILTSGVMGLQYHGFTQSRGDYEKTYRQAHLPLRHQNADGTRYTEWEARHRTVKSSAKRVNVMLGVLGAIWLVNVVDSAVFDPAPVGLSVSF